LLLALAGCGSDRPAPATPVVASPDAAVAAPPAPARPAPEVRVEGALRFEGMPALDDAIAAQLRPYLDARSADVLDLSADGKRLLVTTRFEETRQLYRVDRAGAEPIRLTGEADTISQGRWVPGDADAFLMIADQGGDEQWQLWRIDGAEEVLLTDGESRNLGAVWSGDGKRLAWGSTARNGKDYDLWLSDGVTAASAELVLERSGQWTPIEFSPDGKSLLLAEYVTRARSYLYRYELGSGEVTRLSDDGAVSSPDARWGGKGVVYAISDRDGPDGKGGRLGRRQRLWELRADGAWRVLTADLAHDVEALDVSPDGKTVAFTVNVGGASELRLWDATSRKHRAAPGVPSDGVIGALRFAGKKPLLALSWTSPIAAGDAYLYDVKKATLTRWTNSDLAGLDPAALSVPSLETVESFDGLAVPLWLTPPAPGTATGKAPVVIHLHGGPEGQWRPRFQPFEQFLAARGYAVVQPNVRGSTGYGRAFATADDVLRREDAVRDVGAVLDWIATRPDLDADRVAVVGGSYGGYMVLASLIHHGDRLRAGIDLVGISSFVTFLESTSEYRRDLRRAEYGDERDPEVRAFLEQISPLTRAGEIDRPLFVVQGANDPRVPATEAAQIVSAVRGAGADVWYLVAADEGHGFTRQANKQAYQVAAAQFLARYL
jgi:dipeptidyl aminopeptidase/acylaminoacyl peptidase